MRNFSLVLLVLVFSVVLAEADVGSIVNIPLPRQGAYTGKGMSVGLAGGVFEPGEKCDCLGVWQAQGDFLYYPWLSGGLDVRFFGGDLEKDVLLMYQRYRMSAKAFLHGVSYAFYISPVLGLENTSISEFREELSARFNRKDSDADKENSEIQEDEVDDSVAVEHYCEKIFVLDGFSVGVELGGGVRVGKSLGVTASVLYEYNFERAQQLTITPGVAYDMRRVWGWASKKLLSMWISVELNLQRYFNRGVDSWSKAAVLGFQLGI